MIYVIQYEDLFLANQTIQNKINDLSNYKKLYYEEGMDLESILFQVDLFNSNSGFIIYNCLFLSNSKEFNKQKEMLTNLTKLNDNIDVYFLSDKKMLSNKYITELTQHFKLIEIKSISNKNKKNYIDNLLKTNNLTLSKKIYEHLLSSVNNDCSIINNEINKIKKFLNTNEYDEELLINLISNFNDENIFELIENILLKKHDKVWKIYVDLINKKNDEINIIGAFANQLFNLLFIIKLSNEKKSVSDICQILKIANFVVINCQRKFLKFNDKKINQMLLDLYTLEYNIKTMKINKTLGLKNLIINWMED